MLNLARTDAAEDQASSAPPQVFVRVFPTPPGAPWEQTRAAQLEARHGAPLPMSDLVLRLRRMGAWSPGSPGRFAAFYVRVAEFTAPFETTVDVDGKPVKVAFGASAGHLKHARLAGLAAAVVFVTIAVAGTGVTMALSAKAEASARLDRLEQTLATRRRAALAAQRSATQAKDLKAAVGAGRPLGDVLADLSWASAARSPDARIDAVHWDQGLLAIEARGEVRPFASSERTLERSERPIRPGVWLWGIRVSGENR